ncbi:MAG: ribonuclease H-like domain-containing protein [Methanospirillaceae archaeon]|nr:ribonuclease H-like domain-containing protein [Methanospirillaceae archaeon]
MSSGISFCAVSRQFRNETDANRDYQVIQHDNSFRFGLHPNAVMESVYQDCIGHLLRLLTKYEGLSVPDAISGEEKKTSLGSCYLVHTTQPIDPPNHCTEEIKAIISRDLTLVTGIGKKRAEFFKRRGCRTIPDLRYIRKYADSAEKKIQIIEDGGVRLMDEIIRWHGYSHPATLLTSCEYPPDSFLFLDIETLGIFSRPLFLIGTGVMKDGCLKVSQYLARDINEEASVLAAFLDNISENTVFVTFNGRAFDIPFIQSRLGYYDIPFVLSATHYDLLFFARHYYKKKLHNCRLVTLEEEILKFWREEDIPGAMVPQWYETYLIEENPGPLIPIVYHNQQDIISLAKLFFYFRELAYGDQFFS